MTGLIRSTFKNIFEVYFLDLLIESSERYGVDAIWVTRLFGGDSKWVINSFGDETIWEISSTRDSNFGAFLNGVSWIK